MTEEQEQPSTTVSEAAKTIGVTRAMVQRMIHDGQLTLVRKGQRGPGKGNLVAFSDVEKARLQRLQRLEAQIQKVKQQAPSRARSVRAGVALRSGQRTAHRIRAVLIFDMGSKARTYAVTSRRAS